MSKFDRLTTFVTVFEEKSFAQAARKLGISTAAVSKQVSLLEQELGLMLLTRSTRKLSLTDVGALYFEQAKKILSEMAEIDMLVLQMRGEPMGRLKVVAQRHFAQMYILPNLKSFLESYPKLTLQLELAERFADLEKEGIDILIGMSQASSESDIQKTLGYTNYALCASPAYLKKYGTPKEPKEMRRHRYINHILRTPVDLIRFKNGIEVSVEPYILLNDTRAMKECACKAIGITKLHRYMVQDALASGELVELLADYNEPKQPIFAAYRAQRHVAPKIRAFLDFCYRNCKTAGLRKES